MFPIHRNVVVTPNDSPAQRTNMVKLEEEQGWWTGCYCWFTNHYHWYTNARLPQWALFFIWSYPVADPNPISGRDPLMIYFTQQSLHLSLWAVLQWSGSQSGAHPGWPWWLKDFGKTGFTASFVSASFLQSIISSHRSYTASASNVR